MVTSAKEILIGEPFGMRTANPSRILRLSLGCSAVIAIDAISMQHFNPKPIKLYPTFRPTSLSRPASQPDKDLSITPAT
jgi:hypothetical protein